jgi:hypothetical protein
VRYYGPSGAEQSCRYDWWNSNKGAAGDDMIAAVRRIAGSQRYQQEQMLWQARMHGGNQIAGLSPTAYTRPAVHVQVGETVGLNVIENVCESAQAEICQEKPKCTFLTDSGDWELREKAELLDQFCDGVFDQICLRDVAQDIVQDACIFGTGVMKFYEWPEGEIAVERVFPWELYVDQADGVYRNPRSMYHVKYVDRDVLVGTYPSKREKIRSAKAYPISTGRDAFMHDSVADLVQVVESWHLASYKDAGDGRHVIAVDGATLLDEAWTQPDFPFVTYRWMRRPFGWHGKGITEQIGGIQKEINRLLLKIQRAFARLGITRIYVERGSKVNPAHMRASDGDIVEYTGQHPIQETPPTVSPEIFQHLWALEGKAYDITGVSQMTAQGQSPPPGVDSGRAIRAVLQNHSKRMGPKHDAYAQLFVDCAVRVIRLARDIANRPGSKGFKVRFSSSEGGYREVDFKDIDLEEDKYLIKRFPTSALPSHPGERFQTLQEWFNGGLIDKDMFMFLSDFPDLKAANDLNLALANQKAIRRKVTSIVKRGQPWVPDTYVNLQLAQTTVSAALLNAEEDNVPEERQQMLRDCLETIVFLMNPPPPEPPPAAPGADAGAPGAPGPDQLPPPELGPIPGQVEAMGQMPNPVSPAA